MLGTNKNYLQSRQDFQNKTSHSFFTFQSNKENLLHQGNEKLQHNFHNQYGTQHQTLKIKETQTFNQSSSTASASSMINKNENIAFSGEKTVTGNISRSKEAMCLHKNVQKRYHSFCKDCGIFIPKSGATVCREQIYAEKMDTHPDEIYHIMLTGENMNRFYVQGSSHLNRYRKLLIEWICKVAMDFELSSETTHVAISYIDTILYQETISQHLLQLFALCCLVVAIKFCEKEEKVPSVQELHKICNGHYTLDLFKQSESFILKTLDWHVKSITPFHFIQFYLSKGCVFSSDYSAIRNVDIKLLRYLRKYTEFFVDLSIQNYELNSYKSHILACAAIAGARKAVGLFPIWNNDLEELSRATWQDIEPCFVILYSAFETNFPDIASKANTYTEKYLKRDDVNDLEKSYAAMTIESSTSTPFRNDGQENMSEPKSSEKKTRPSTLFMTETKRLKMVSDWTSREELQKAGNYEVIHINLPKKIQDNSKMFVEKKNEGLMQNLSHQNSLKRNLVF